MGYGFLMQKLLDRKDIQDTISRYSLGQDSHQGKDSNILQQWEAAVTLSIWPRPTYKSSTACSRTPV